MESVGNYEYNPKDILGQGAFAVVYKGREKKNPSKTVAIKSVSKKRLNKPDVLEKEIKILQELTKLHHKNVVALFDCKDSPHHVYLIIEYCKGGDLADYLSNKRMLSEHTIRHFLIQLAEAMKALCDKGIVHRDLKPQNILITYDVPNPLPSQLILKIADFGFARFLQAGNMANTVCGSPMYMAPEVLMSQKYDIKADLWSIGTIVFQCLTGDAPFKAPTPQVLREKYHNTKHLVPEIPPGTSPELKDLLLGLLTRNTKERLNCDQFFNHRFLKKVEIPKASPVHHDIFQPLGTPPNLVMQISSPRFVRANSVTQLEQPESPRSTRAVLSSSLDEDYVMVPHMIEGQSAESAELEKLFKSAVIRSPNVPGAVMASPLRPSFLPVSEPVPVPTMKEAYRLMTSQSEKNDEGTKASVSFVPRSQPITMQRCSEKRQFHNDIDLSSISPPSVKFVLGTPPGGRRRSTSGGSLCDCETPPQANHWAASAIAKTAPINSPLRRAGTSPPVTSGPLARMAIFSSPNLNHENNNPNRSFNMPYCTRAVTLPEISEIRNPYHDCYEQHPITFIAPELPEETLFEKEHNETLAKINFVSALSSCVLDLAAIRAAPFGNLHDSMHFQIQNDFDKKAERFALLLRAMQILGQGLALGYTQLKSGQLQRSAKVKSVMSSLNEMYKLTVNECKQLRTAELLAKVPYITVDALLYKHAVEICGAGALDELHHHFQPCYEKYQTAQLLLHSLTQKVTPEDKELVKSYKEAVEKRLFLLQEQGYVYSTNLSEIN